MSSWSALYQNWNKGGKRRKSQVVASLSSLSFSKKINLYHHSPGQLMFLTVYFLLQDLEVVVLEVEEESEVKMDQAWIFLTSSAPSDLSLLKEGFHGKT